MTAETTASAAGVVGLPHRERARLAANSGRFAAKLRCRPGSKPYRCSVSPNTLGSNGYRPLLSSATALPWARVVPMGLDTRIQSCGVVSPALLSRPPRVMDLPSRAPRALRLSPKAGRCGMGRRPGRGVGSLALVIGRPNSRRPSPSRYCSTNRRIGYMGVERATGRGPPCLDVDVGGHDRAEQDPSLAVEARHLHLLDRVKVGRASVDLDPRQQHRQC